MTNERISSLIKKKSVKSINRILSRIKKMKISQKEIKINLNEVYKGFNHDGDIGANKRINKEINKKISGKCEQWHEREKGKYIYIFEAEKKVIDGIVKDVASFRDQNDQNKSKGDKKIAITSVNDGKKSTACLYVGKSKDKIVSRITNHLGKPSKGTFAMRLFDVLKDSLNRPRELKITLVSIPGINDVTHNLIEAVIAAELNPALGSHEDID